MMYSVTIITEQGKQLVVEMKEDTLGQEIKEVISQGGIVLGIEIQ